MLFILLSYVRDVRLVLLRLSVLLNLMIGCTEGHLVSFGNSQMITFRRVNKN